MTNETRIKHRRFKRGTAPVPHRITRRDVEILRQVAKHRFLNSDQIVRLVEHLEGGSHNHTRRSLTKLFRAGYLDKPRQQLRYYARHGSECHVYALADLGAKVVQERTDMSLGKISWSRNNERAGQLFIEHTIGIANVMAGIEMAARKREHTRLVEAEELVSVASRQVRASKRPWRFDGRIDTRKHGQPVRIYPDAAFALELTDRGRPERVNFVVEVDRGTMPVVRAERLMREYQRCDDAIQNTDDEVRELSLHHAREKARAGVVAANCTQGQSSFMKKLAIYHAAWANKWHTERFNWRNFRVLTVTTTADRIARMQQAVHTVTGGRSAAMFLFATAEAVDQADDLLKFDWQDGNAKIVRIES